MNFVWDFSSVLRYQDLLWVGLANTLQLTVLAYVFGLPIGIALALARLSRIRVISVGFGFIIDFFRCTPSLVQLFWFFFALPRIIGVRLDPFSASLICLTILSSAFVAEIFRGGIASIERGQWEGARALGMNYVHIMGRVILPQAIKRMLPVFLERAIELLKTSTIAAAISYPDLLFQANEISHRSYRPLEVFTTVAVIFLVVVTIGSQLTRLLERRLARSGESTVH